MGRRREGSVRIRSVSGWGCMGEWCVLGGGGGSGDVLAKVTAGNAVCVRRSKVACRVAELRSFSFAPVGTSRTYLPSSSSFFWPSLSNCRRLAGSPARSFGAAAAQTAGMHQMHRTDRCLSHSTASTCLLRPCGSPSPQPRTRVPTSFDPFSIRCRFFLYRSLGRGEERGTSLLLQPVSFILASSTVRRSHRRRRRPSLPPFSRSFLSSLHPRARSFTPSVRVFPACPCAVRSADYLYKEKSAVCATFTVKVTRILRFFSLPLRTFPLFFSPSSRLFNRCSCSLKFSLFLWIIELGSVFAISRRRAAKRIRREKHRCEGGH